MLASSPAQNSEIDLCCHVVIPQKRVARKYLCVGISKKCAPMQRTGMLHASLGLQGELLLPCTTGILVLLPSLHMLRCCLMRQVVPDLCVHGSLFGALEMCMLVPMRADRPHRSYR